MVTCKYNKVCLQGYYLTCPLPPKEQCLNDFIFFKFTQFFSQILKQIYAKQANFNSLWKSNLLNFFSKCHFWSTSWQIFKSYFLSFYFFLHTRFVYQQFNNNYNFYKKRQYNHQCKQMKTNREGTSKNDSLLIFYYCF